MSSNLIKIYSYIFFYFQYKPMKFFNSLKSNTKKNNKNDEFLIYKLEISKLVSLNGICESILYGEVS